MSRTYFHSEHGDAELRGSERAYAGNLCSDMFIAAMGLDGFAQDDWLRKVLTLFPEDHYLRRQPPDARAIETALRVGQEFFTTALNTANVLGSDSVRLLARLHGQCEIHGYVEGPDRAWLAGIIEQGRESKIYRGNMGWEEIAAFLRSRDDCPVVTSYSVCDGFPNAHVAGWKDDHDGDDWYELPEAEQWSRAMTELRKDVGLRWQPGEPWQAFYFEDGTTAFDLIEQLNEPVAAPEPR